MSTASGSGLHLAALALVAGLGFGCWEQMDDGKWFPQMKRQPAVQAFEENLLAGPIQGFTPPEGSVPVGGDAVPDLARLTLPEQEALANPVPASLDSLKRGEVLFHRYCATCHGSAGHGDGPVAGAPFGTGPFGMVLPIGGPSSIARALSDGHIYTTVSMGRGRMPSYRRISPTDRWNLINYLREMNAR